jgi:hypothetical protein
MGARAAAARVVAPIPVPQVLCAVEVTQRLPK